MKIAYILTSLANAGPIVVVHDLVQLMTSHGHYVDVYYFDNKKELDFSCPTHKISMTSAFNFAKYDIVHCHGFRPDIYVLLHKPWFSKTPICTTIHSYMEQDHAFKYGKKWSKITSLIVLTSTIRDDRIILLSKDMCEHYKRKLPADKLTYAYNTHIPDFIHTLSPVERNEIMVFKGDASLLCSISGLNKIKGILQIIKALPLLPDIKYCIVGDGPELHNLEMAAISLGIKDRVFFVGYKDEGFRYLAFADVFAIPSYSEGFPLAMLEAASMGKAIVCSDIPVFKEVFSDEEVARFKNDDIQSLKDAIEFALVNKSKLGQNARKRFDRQYSPDFFYNRHIAIYSDIIRKKSR